METVFREAHSLKGAARAVNLVQVESACQSLESLFAQLKSREVTLSAELFDRLHQTVDAVIALLSAGSTEAPQGDEAQTFRTPEPSQSAPQVAENVPAPPRIAHERPGISRDS